MFITLSLLTNVSVTCLLRTVWIRHLFLRVFVLHWLVTTIGGLRHSQPNEIRTRQTRRRSTAGVKSTSGFLVQMEGKRVLRSLLLGVVYVH